MMSSPVHGSYKPLHVVSMVRMVLQQICQACTERLGKASPSPSRHHICRGRWPGVQAGSSLRTAKHLLLEYQRTPCIECCHSLTSTRAEKACQACNGGCFCLLLAGGAITQDPPTSRWTSAPSC